MKRLIAPVGQWKAASACIVAIASAAWLAGSCRGRPVGNGLGPDCEPVPEPTCAPDGSCGEQPLPTGEAYFGVWGSGPSDVWAVGSGETIVHWDGVKWSLKHSGADTSLFSVWGSGPDNVWTVGQMGTVLHWNGRCWRRVDLGTDLGLYGVAGSAANDVWVVGQDALSFHWDGSEWTGVDTGGDDHLFAVWVTAPDDVWAVGGWGCQSITLHWDGSQWNDHSPSGPDSKLRAVWGSAPNDIWAAGGRGDCYWDDCCSFDGNSPFHWDGSQWLELTESFWWDDVYASGAHGIWGSGPDDVWMVGYFSDWNYQGPYIIHWNGIEFSPIVPTVPGEPGFVNHTLLGIWGSGPSDVWTVGYMGTVLHWDGNQWSSLSGN